MLLSKLLTQAVYPLNFALAGIAVGIVLLLCKKRRTGLWLTSLFVCWLWVWSTPAFSGWIRGTLEQRYMPVAVEKMEAADAIVVLGGAVATVIPPRIYPDLGPASDRVWQAARLYEAGKAPLIIVSGGGSIFTPNDTTRESDAMADFLKALKVPDSAIVRESESMTTQENADFTKRILDARGIKKILLVTSALHMPRALAIFRTLGITVIPAPTDYEIADEGKRMPFPILPDALALEGSSRAFKEYVGLFVFRLVGR